MATILVYNNDTTLIERYELGEASPMPYNAGGTMLVREFRGSSRSQLLWTDKASMQAWNTTRTQYGGPIYLGYAYKRIWEGGHGTTSQHYAGTAFDCGQNLTTAERNRLWQTAYNSGVWVYVEPQYLTPTWVHMDRRLLPPSCTGVPYVLVRQGSRNQYVMILQDALSTLGYNIGSSIDGIFGPRTRAGVVSYQQNNGLQADGIVGCATWRSVATRVVGTGRTSTTLS